MSGCIKEGWALRNVGEGFRYSFKRKRKQSNMSTDPRKTFSSNPPSRTGSSSSKNSLPPSDYGTDSRKTVSSSSSTSYVQDTSDSPITTRNPKWLWKPLGRFDLGRILFCFVLALSVKLFLDRIFTDTLATDKIRRQMSNIGRATSVMEVRINEENSAISKGLPSEDDVKKVSESIERNDPKRIKLIREKLQKDVKRSFKETMMYIFRAQAIYVLLPAVPVALTVGALGLSPGIVFGVNCFAIIPLAAVLSFATEELGFHSGEAVSGFLNATFGNAVELIVSLFALRRGEIRIVQASMLGSILSNLLLVRFHDPYRFQ